MVKITASVLGCVMLMACGPAPGAPARSPSLDYAPPVATTADGDTVGADRQGPGDKLHEGITSDGPAPGWDASKKGVTNDPKQRVGGAIDPPPANGSSSSK